jgi:hypothetical protein
MAQVPKRGLVILAHPPREIRIIQVLVPRGLRHVLQHAQALLDGALAIWRHLLPPGQDIIADVLPLFRSQLTPHLSALLQFLPLSGWQLIEFLLILQYFLFVFLAQILEAPRIGRWIIPGWRTVLVQIGPCPGLPARVWRPVRIRIPRMW